MTSDGTGNRIEFIRSLHVEKQRAHNAIVKSGDVELRPGVSELITVARERGYRLAIAITTTPANIDALYG